MPAALMATTNASTHTLHTKAMRAAAPGKRVARTETERMKAETHDLERQLDQLRLQMQLEKDKQSSITGNGGTIWGSSTSIKAKRAGKPRKKLTGDRPGSKTGGRPKSQPEKEAAVPVPDGDFEAVAEFDGPRPGSIFKAGPNGTGYYRDAPAAGPAAGPQVHTVRPSSASGYAPPSKVAPPPPSEDGPTIGEQMFSLDSTFGDNYAAGSLSDLLFSDDGGLADLRRTEDVAPASIQPSKEGFVPAPDVGSGEFNEEESHASFLAALSDWRGEPAPAPQPAAGGRRPPHRTSAAVGTTAAAASAAAAKAATPFEMQTESSKPLYNSRPSSAAGQAAAGASRRKSYFEEMMEEKAKEKVAGAGVRSSTPAAGDRPETPGPTRVAVQEELLRLRGAAAAQQAGLAELRAANATRRAKNTHTKMPYRPRSARLAGPTAAPAAQAAAEPAAVEQPWLSRPDWAPGAAAEGESGVMAPGAAPAPAVATARQAEEAAAAKEIAHSFSDMLVRPRTGEER